MKRYDPAAERERLEKALHDLTNRMLEIGFMLDDDSISDSEFSRLEKEEIEIVAKIGKCQTRFDFLNVHMISNVSDWTAEFLESFGTGTRKVSNRQADCLRRVNNGKPFIYKGRRYDCRGANYRAGFGTLIITDLEGTEILPETETTETETTETETTETETTETETTETETTETETTETETTETTETETTETTETETTETETTETETTETTETETTDRDATATGRCFYDTEHNICITDFDLLEEWKNDPCIRREYPWFDWYVAACQTYQGGTLEEIR